MLWRSGIAKRSTTLQGRPGEASRGLTARGQPVRRRQGSPAPIRFRARRGSPRRSVARSVAGASRAAAAPSVLPRGSSEGPMRRVRERDRASGRPQHEYVAHVVVIYRMCPSYVRMRAVKKVFCIPIARTFIRQFVLGTMLSRQQPQVQCAQAEMNTTVV